MKKRLLSLLLLAGICSFAFGALAVSAEEEDEMILLSSYGSGYCINTEEMQIAEGDGAAVYLDFAYLEGEVESVGFLLTPDPYTEDAGAHVLLTPQGASVSEGAIVRGDGLTPADLLSEKYETRGEFYPSEGTFRILRRGRKQINWQTVLLAEGIEFAGSGYCGFILNGQCDVYLHDFRVEKIFAEQEIGYTSVNMERTDRYTIGAGSAFTLDSGKENRLANLHAFAAGEGEVRLTLQAESIRSDSFGFGLSSSQSLFSEEGLYVSYGEKGTTILYDGVPLSSANVSASLSLSQAVRLGARTEAVFIPSQGKYALYADGELLQTADGLPVLTGAHYAGMQFAAGTQAEVLDWSVAVAASGGEALAAGGAITLELPAETVSERVDSGALYSFAGETYYPDGEGGFYTQRTEYIPGDPLPLTQQGVTAEGGVFTGGTGYIVNSEAADLSAEGMTLVMEYSVGERIDTSAVLAGNWLGIVVTDRIVDGNNQYTTDPQNALMAFPKGQEWQAGVAMDDAFLPNTDYRITYDPQEQTVIYEYSRQGGEWKRLGNGIYLPAFGDGVRLNNANVYMALQAYDAPVSVDLSQLRIYTVRKNVIVTPYPDIGEVTDNDGYITNASPFDLNDATAFFEFTVLSFSGSGENWGITWNSALTDATYLQRTLFGEYPLIGFTDEWGMPSAEELFQPGVRIRFVYAPDRRTLTVETRPASDTSGAYLSVAKVENLEKVCFDSVYFGFQFASGVQLEMGDIRIYSVGETHTVRKVYRSQDGQGNTLYIAESTGTISHENGLELSEGEQINASLTVLEYTAPADRVLIGEDEGMILSPYIEVHLSSVDPTANAADGFGVRYYNTTTYEYAAQTAVVGETGIVGQAHISQDLTQFDVFAKGALRFSYDPAAGVFTVLHGEKVIQTVTDLHFSAERYYMSFVMQTGILLKTNDLAFYTSDGVSSATVYDSAIAADEWTGDGKDGSSIQMTADAALTLTGERISLDTEFRTYNAQTDRVSGYSDPVIFSEKADISNAGDFIAMEFTVLSFEDLQRTINFIGFGLVSEPDASVEKMALNTDSNLFVCYRPAYGVTDSYYHSHFYHIVPGIFSQRHVSQSNFMKSGAKVRIRFQNGGERNTYPFYELSYKTASMQDFEVLQYVYALTSMPLQNVQFAFIASSNEENPGIATTMRYLFRDLRFYTSGSAETYAYDGTEDVFVSSEPAVIPVTMNVEAGDDSLGSVEGGGTYLRGDSITVSAQPAQGAIFEGWYLRTPEGELTDVFSPEYRLSRESVFTFTLGDTVDSNRAFTLVARFVPAVEGKVITRAEENILFGIGLIYTVSANAPAGQVLDHWEWNGKRVETHNDDGSITFTAGDSDFTLRAVYKAGQSGNTVTVYEENADKPAADAVTAATVVLTAVTLLGTGGMIAWAVIRKRR